MDFKENNSCVYFFVDNKGSVKINKMNNSEEDVRSMYFTRHDASVLLFAYDYYGGILYVMNLQKDSLLELLEIRKEGSGSSDEFLQQTLDQLQCACEFLNTTYKWKGSIVAGVPKHDEVVRLTIKDYSLAWGYLTASLWNLNFEVLNLNIYVMSELDNTSEFVQEGETYSTSLGNIQGPAILLKRTNSSFDPSKNIIYQYYTNLAKLYNFDTGDRGAFMSGIANYLEDTLVKYMNSESVGERSNWYMFSRNGQVFIERNDKQMTADQISEKFGSYKVVVNFSYVRTFDSGYIIITDMGSRRMNSGVHNEMYEFLMDNLDIIGHVNIDGKVIDEEPLFLFDDFSKKLEWQNIDETPVWVYIKTILSECYDFNYENIPVLKGEFKENFDTKFVSEINDSNKDIVGEYADRVPFIVWNTNTDNRGSYLGCFHSLINEYLKYMSYIGEIEVDIYASEDPHDMMAYLENIEDNILGDSQQILMFENEMLLGVEFSKYYHEYNTFMLMFDVLSFDRDRIESALSKLGKEESDKMASLADSIHQKMYYVLLKMIGVLAFIKYGEDIESDGAIIHGSLVVRKGFLGNMMRVESINLVGDGHKLYNCVDLVTRTDYHFTEDKLTVFDLSFENYEEYNKKIVVASSSSDTHDFYENLLSKWLRNPYTKEVEEAEVADIPSHQSYESLLRAHNEYYDHTTDAILTEVLLNDTRKANNGK
jgi:hypothetical protein